MAMSADEARQLLLTRRLRFGDPTQIQAHQLLLDIEEYSDYLAGFHRPVCLEAAKVALSMLYTEIEGEEVVVRFGQGPPQASASVH